MAYPSHGPYAQRPHAPKRSSNKGCIIALAVMGVLGLVAVIAIAVGVYFITQNEQVRKIASTARDGVEIMRDAQKAPGTRELRKSGCHEALVLDMARLFKLAERFVDAGAGMPAEMPSKLVVCSMASAGSAPDCSTVAKTYLGAVPKPTKRFAVTVQVNKKEQPECSELFDPAGTSLGPFDRSAAPPIPTGTP